MVGFSCLYLKFSQRVVRIKEKKLVLKRKEILPCGLAGYVRHDNQKINSTASGNDNFVRTTKHFFLCDEHTTCSFPKKNSEVKV